MPLGAYGKILKPELLVLPLILGLFAFHWQNLFTPIYWDEIFPYVAPAKELKDMGVHRALPGLYDSRIALGHPQGFVALLAMVLQLTGESVVALKALTLALSALALFFTFKIGQFFHGSVAGLMAASLLLFSPDFIARAHHVLPEGFLLGVGALCVYLALTGTRKNLLFALLVWLALVKETSLAIVLPCGLYQLWAERKNLRLGIFARALLPSLSLGVFFLIEKLKTGNFTNFPNTATIASTPAQYFRGLTQHSARFGEWTLQGHFYLVVLGALGLVYACYKRKIHPGYLLLLTIPLCFLGGVPVLTEINFRYYSPALPFAILLMVFGVLHLLARKSFLVLVCGLAFAAAKPEYYSAVYNNPGVIEDYSLLYAKQVRQIHEGVAEFDRAYPSGSVYGGWPLSYALVAPFMGYVNSPRGIQGRWQAEYIIQTTASPWLEYEQNGKWLRENGAILLKEVPLTPKGYIRFYRNPRAPSSLGKPAN